MLKDWLEHQRPGIASPTAAPDIAGIAARRINIAAVYFIIVATMTCAASLPHFASCGKSDRKNGKEKALHKKKTPLHGGESFEFETGGV